MKTIYRTFFLAAISFFSMSANAQLSVYEYPDRLTFLFGNDVKMIIDSKEILRIRTEKIQDTLFSCFITDMCKVQDSLSRLDVPILISYCATGINFRKMTVKANQGTKSGFIFKSNSDTVATSIFNYSIDYCLNPGNKLVIYTNNLTALGCLKNVSLSGLIRQVLSDLVRRKITTVQDKMCTYIVKNNQIDIANGTIKKELGLNIPMGLEMGGSFIGGNFYSSLSCSYSLVYQIRDGVYLLPGLSTTLFTDNKWITGNQLKSGSFLDVFINLKAPNSSLFYGTDTKLYFGYLFRQKGYLFPKNTWRFGIEVPVGKSMRLDFSNYFSGHDNSACLGLGFKYIFF